MPVRPSRSTTTVAMLARFSNSSLSSTPTCTASKPPRPLASLLSDLALAERDTRLSAVVLRVRSLEIGWAKAQEIRNAIVRLGEHGRRTIAYLELESFNGNLEYYVASAAQELFVS